MTESVDSETDILFKYGKLIWYFWSGQYCNLKYHILLTYLYSWSSSALLYTKFIFNYVIINQGQGIQTALSWRPLSITIRVSLNFMHSGFISNSAHRRYALLKSQPIEIILKRS